MAMGSLCHETPPKARPAAIGARRGPAAYNLHA